MVRAVVSLPAVLLLLLVESAAGHRLAAEPVWRNLLVSSLITNAAAGWSWAMDIKNLSFVVSKYMTLTLKEHLFLRP